METPQQEGYLRKMGDCMFFSVCVVVYYADRGKGIYNQATKYGPGRFYHIDIILHVYFRIVRVKKPMGVRNRKYT